MTVKMKVMVEPTDETAKVTVVREREGEREPFRSEFNSVVALESPWIDVEVGDRIQVALEAGQKIVLDDDQNCLTLEDLDKGEVKKEREAKKKEEEEKVEEYKREWEARGKEASRLKAEKKSVAGVPPLPEGYKTKKQEELEGASAHAEGGGAPRANPKGRHPS